MEETAHADLSLRPILFVFFQGTDLLTQAKASADKAIADKNFRATATDAKVSSSFHLSSHLSTRRFVRELKLTPFPPSLSSPRRTRPSLPPMDSSPMPLPLLTPLPLRDLLRSTRLRPTSLELPRPWA